MKILASLLAAVGLLIAGNVTPAAATPPGYFYLPAGQGFQMTYGICTVSFVYGNYGNVAFAYLESNYGVCNKESGTKVQAWGDESHMCRFYEQGFTDCTIIGGYAVQAVAVGTLIGGVARICSGATTNPPCVEVKFSPIP